ncbi:MAG: ABC transporter substrate-binding protein [Deltaproteobacteria bacterium]|nr:ABC transporter substrate-binding protein [Deltaproteobacteria bacterium]
MKKPLVSIIVVVIVIVGAALIYYATRPPEAVPTIKIGVIGPMQYVQGIGHWNGATMAADEINAAGGIQVGEKKMNIELVQADSNEFINITDATNAMERLITNDKVDFIVGGFRTEAVLPMQDIAMENKKIFIGVGAAHNELCLRVAKDYDTYKYFFRGSPFNSSFLGRTSFIHLGTVAAIMKMTLNIPKIKVAIAAEKAMWTEPLIKASESVIPKMGMELVGVWRPSPIATDVTAELSAIQRSGAHIIFTIFSSSVGIPFARQAGELKIPAVQVGINVEAQKDGFWQATQEMGNYVSTLNTYCRGVEYNELTKPFVDGYVERFGETPTYTADTYTAIKYALAPTIEKAGTLDADALVAILENASYMAPSGKVEYLKDEKGNHMHELKWGPGNVTSLGVQWQDGELKGFWPNKWKIVPEAPEVTYKGIVPYKIPPWVIDAYKQ